MKGIKREMDDQTPLPCEQGRVVCLIDASGSMEGSEVQTVEGINGLLKGLEETNPGFDYTIYTFSQSRFLELQRYGGAELKLMDIKRYTTMGTTSLYDVLANTIYEEENCTIVVATDGEDTSSTLHTEQDVRVLICETTKSKGLKFKFIAQGMEAYKAVSSISQKEEDVVYVSEDGLGSALKEQSFVYTCSQSMMDDQEEDSKRIKFVTQNSPEL